MFLLAIYTPLFLPEDSTANIYILAVTIIIFGALFFASYDLRTATTITTAQNVTILDPANSRTVYEYETTNTYFTEQAFSWMFLALSMVSVILFVWEIWKQAKGLPKV